MTTQQSTSLAACLVQLTIALFALRRGGRSSLARPLSLLCLAIAGFTGASVAYELTHQLAWDRIDHALSPLTAPLALHFALVFVGRRRALGRFLTLAYLGAFVISAMEPAFVVMGRAPWRGATWDACVLFVAIPTMAMAVWLLGAHARDTTDPSEKSRARLLLSSFALATALGSTELVNVITPAVPSLSGIGMLLGTIPMAFATFRLRLFERVATLRLVSDVIFAAAIIIALGTALVRFVPHAGSFVVLAGILGLAIVAVSRSILVESAARRERSLHLATLGRFSAQMAHDVMNPLAALRGATQVLQLDLETPSSEVDRIELVELMLGQIDRVGRIVDLYGRLASVEPNRTPLDLNEVVRTTLEAQMLDDTKPRLEADLAERLPTIEADRDMMASIVENLVRNAIAASTSPSRIYLRTRLLDGAKAIALEVEDEGHGMDARTRERAFDDFFTTKAEGSGLGLSFVKRIATAHGGSVHLSSRIGHGTLVTIRLPTSPAHVEVLPVAR